MDALSSVQLPDDVLAHCGSTYRTVHSHFICLQTQNTRVSLSQLQSIGSFELTVVPCPKYSSLHETLRLALENMPLSIDLPNVARMSHMISMCRSLISHSQNSRLMRGLPRTNVHYVSKLVTEATRSITEHLNPQALRAVLHPYFHLEPDAVELDHPETAVPADLVSYLSPFWWRVLSTVLTNRNDILGLGILTRSFQLVHRQMFHSPSRSRDHSDVRLSSFYHRSGELHRKVSSCLGRLRDAYASLISAGSCLSARVRLSDLEKITDSASLKLEQGRARLFISAQSARNNVVRILRNEVIPFLRDLTTECEEYAHAIKVFILDKQFMGPFLSNSPYLFSPECRKTALTIKQSLIALGRQCDVQSASLRGVSHKYNTPNTFHEIALRMHRCLERQLADFLISFQTSLYLVSKGLKRSLQAVEHTWVDAFTCLDEGNLLVDCRAASDVQLLAGKLQEQYDLIEAFIRKHHNNSFPVLYDAMFSTQSLLVKAGSHQIQVDSPYRQLVDRVQIPYGSKNKTERTVLLDNLREMVSVPDWPPIHSTKTTPLGESKMVQTSNSPISDYPQTDTQSLPIVIMRRADASSLYVVPPRPDAGCLNVPLVSVPRESSGFLLSPRAAVQSRFIRKLASADLANANNSQPESSSMVNTSSSAAATSSGPGIIAVGAKRVCIRLPNEQQLYAGSTEIIEQKVFKSGSNISVGLPLIRTVRMDRRRLGRLKRRMKITHSVCVQKHSKRSEQPVDTSPVDLCSESSEENLLQLLADEGVTVYDLGKDNDIHVKSAESALSEVENDAVLQSVDATGTKANSMEENVRKCNVHFDILNSAMEMEKPSRNSTTASQYQSDYVESETPEHALSVSLNPSSASNASATSETASDYTDVNSVSNAPISNSTKAPPSGAPDRLCLVQEELVNQHPVDSDNMDQLRSPPKSTSYEPQSAAETEGSQTFLAADLKNSVAESEATRAGSLGWTAGQNRGAAPDGSGSLNLETGRDSAYPNAINNTATSASLFVSALPESIKDNGSFVSRAAVSSSLPCSPTSTKARPVSRLNVQPSANIGDITHSNFSSSPVSPISPPVLPNSNHSARIGILLKQVTAELSELAPWFDKYGNSQCPAPGPVTAAALGQLSPLSTAPALSSLDLISEDY